MTRTKLDLATHLLKLCNDTTTDPQKLADVMTIRKLHFEIEKAESELEEIESKITEVKNQAKPKTPKSLWSFLTVESDEDCT
jgi:hypothetical protein